MYLDRISSRSGQLPNILAIGLALSWAVAFAPGPLEAQIEPATSTVDIAAAPDFFGTVERVAVLSQRSDGTAYLTAKYIDAQGLFGEPGSRLLNDVTLDGAGIWGSGGVAVVMSSVAASGSLFVLLEDLRVVQLDGIWGSGGVAQPTQVTIHGPLWDVDACGEATALAEVLRASADPDAAADQVNFAVGTEGGCVGFAPYDTATGTLQPTDGPLVAIWGTGGVAQPVDDLAVVTTTMDWYPDPLEWLPDPVNWIPPRDGWTAPAGDWYPNPNEWLPVTESWPEVAALSGDRVFSVFPGVAPEGGLLGAPPTATFTLETPSIADAAVSAASRDLPLDSSQKITTGGGVPAEWPLIVANGTETVYAGAVGPGVQPGRSSPLEINGSALIVDDAGPVQIKQVELGSLWMIGADGQTVLYAPEYNTFDGTAGPIFPLGGVQAVHLGPRGFHLDANGRFFNAQIEAAGDDIHNIDWTSLELTVQGDPAPLPAQNVKAADEDDDGNQELSIKFPRDEVAAKLDALYDPGDEARLTLSWDYVDLCEFDPDEPCSSRYEQLVRIVNE